MVTPFGRERLTAATTDVQRRPIAEGLEPILQELNQFAVREREDWERTEIAKARASLYQMADQVQTRIAQGEVVEGEEEFSQQYRNEVEKRIGALNPRIQGRARAELAATGALVEADLKGKLREYYGQRRLADLGQTTDVHVKTAIDAPTDEVAQIILEQAEADIHGSIELSPVQKQAHAEDIRKRIWGSRLGARLRDPGQNLEQSRAWIDSLNLDATTREAFRETIRVQGAEIKRAEAVDYLSQSMNLFIAQPEQRADLAGAVRQYLDNRAEVYKPGEREKILQEWSYEANKQALFRDVDTMGPEAVRKNLAAYGLDETQTNWAIDYLDREHRSRQQEAAYVENRVKESYNEERNQYYQQQLIELRDNPDPAAIRKLLTEVRMDGARGFRNALFIDGQARALGEEEERRQELRSGIEAKRGVVPFTQQEADQEWSDVLRRVGDEQLAKREAGQNEPIDVEGLLKKFVQDTKVLPTPIKGSIAGKIQGQQDAGGIREAAELIRGLRNSAIYQQFDAAERSVLQRVTRDMGDGEVAKIVEQVYAGETPEGQFRRKSLQDKKVQKELSTQFMQGIRSASTMARTFDLAQELYPEMGAGFEASEEMEGASLVESAYLQRLEELYAWSGDLQNSKANAMADTLKQYGPWRDGTAMYWMEHSPVNYLRDVGWVEEKLHAWLDTHGVAWQVQEPEASVMMRQLVPTGGSYQPVPLQRIPIRLSVMPGTENDAFPVYYVYHPGETGRWEPVTDEDGNPRLWGGGDLAADYETERLGKIATERHNFEAMETEQRKQSQADEALRRQLFDQTGIGTGR
jgi:hypothetical protein